MPPLQVQALAEWGTEDRVVANDAVGASDTFDGRARQERPRSMRR